MVARCDALVRRLTRSDRDDKGFTLVELLVVVIIIGILAAIAIPIYIGIQNGAKNAEVKSDLSNAQLALVAASTDDAATFSIGQGESDLSDAAVAKYKDFGMTRGTKVQMEVQWGAPTNFCIQGQNTDVKKYFSIDTSGGIQEGTCHDSSGRWVAGN